MTDYSNCSQERSVIANNQSVYDYFGWFLLDYRNIMYLCPRD